MADSPIPDLETGPQSAVLKKGNFGVALEPEVVKISCYALLVGSLIVLMIVEVLNTAVEAACNALSREFNSDIQFAKDCGSLAVLLAVALAAIVWLLALIDFFQTAVS